MLANSRVLLFLHIFCKPSIELYCIWSFSFFFFLWFGSSCEERSLGNNIERSEHWPSLVCVKICSRVPGQGENRRYANRGMGIYAYWGMGIYAYRGMGTYAYRGMGIYAYWGTCDICFVEWLVNLLFSDDVNAVCWVLW